LDKPENNRVIEEIEIRLFLEGVFQKYGYDFRNYAPASLKRRILKCLQEENFPTVSAFQEKILRSPDMMLRFLLTISIDVTSMFRDPEMFRILREKIVPELRQAPLIRVWNVGCSSGEEVYSTAILLTEENLYDHSRIYATDMSETVLDRAKSGIYPFDSIQTYTKNYLAAGGKEPFSKYYDAKYENAIFKSFLKKNIVWAQHNLVTDGSFNEFHIILCRNVMIYFNKTLQEQVHRLLYDSLAVNGYLCLGDKESLKFSPLEERYESISERVKLYRKIK